jgi:dTDP-4-dehydrorhamnose reductase
VRNLAMVCRNYDIPLLHISTDYVFSGEKNTPYIEQDATAPLGIYGKSKLIGEEILAKTWEKHVILRISWVFGKYGSNFVKTILRLAKEREELNVVSDQHGCPSEASDVARVLLTMASQIINGKSSWGIYHYCGYPVTSWFEFAENIIDLGLKKYDFKLKWIHAITTDEYPTRAMRPKNSELLVNKIIRDYGIERRSWVDCLEDVINVIEL